MSSLINMLRYVFWNSKKIVIYFTVNPIPLFLVITYMLLNEY